MNAHGFYKEFMRRICDTPELMKEYKNSSEYTKLIIPLINEIIKESRNDYKLEEHELEQQSCFGVQNEYFRIDACGWVSHFKSIESQAEKLGLKPHLWDLKIAVEHENDKSDWLDEVMKLIHVKCPTKVVIGYSDADDRENDLFKLAFVARCMKQVQAFREGWNEEYLVILGNAKIKEDITSYKQFGYRGYIYNWETEQFDTIKEC
ncbi:MAG: hypothetical protein E7297_09830 [Lachnospiraceae bacterium]|jgi:hypothetical protein|nr:hypothetical protein [Lachnospiraceae bacterium]